MPQFASESRGFPGPKFQTESLPRFQTDTLPGIDPAPEAYLAECRVCGLSLRPAEGLVGVDAAHIRWHAHGGPDEVANGLALCALHHRLFDHGAITVLEDLRLRVAAALSGSSARGPLGGLDGRAMRPPVDRRLYPQPAHLRWHHAQVFHGRL